MKRRHQSVLLQEILSGLAPRKGAVYLDLTLGDGGHAEAVSGRIGPSGHVIGLDRDQSAITRSRAFLAASPSRMTLQRAAWGELGRIMDEAGESAVDIALLDLGMSAFELEESGKGFSFQRDEPLRMTYGDPAEAVFTARDIVNSWDEEHLRDILLGYGEEKKAARIAKAIVARRAEGPIEGTKDLVAVVEGVFRGARGKIHPATRVFQALRMAVNDDVGELERALPAVWSYLRVGGRLAVISFESVTDRIVKRFMKERESGGEGKRINKKVLRASREEGMSNPRARSAKLRIIEKLR